MFRRFNWVVVLLTTVLVYFGALAAPAISQIQAERVEFTSAEL